jgi:predicted PurR-regulated permease PerM
MLSPESDPKPNDWESRSHIQTLVLMVVTAVGIYLCYRLIDPFLSALAWALTLAVLFAPFQRWLEAKVLSPSLAAAIAVTVIGLSVVVPVTFVGHGLVMQADNGAKLIEAKVASGEWRRAFEGRPRLGSLAVRIERHLNLPDTVKSLTAWLSATAGNILKGSVFQLIGLCLTFYLLFFFLRDRRGAFLLLRALAPLSHDEMERVFSRVGDTIHATIIGTLIVAGVQGTLGGLMFWGLGLSAPFFWGVVMAMLAVVPMLGAFIVWVPAALFLALEGSWDKSMILAIWGVAVVGLIDNILLPILIRKRLRLHPALAFIAVVGGLMLFGPAGLVLGPVVVTITMVLLETWTSRTSLVKGS